MKHSTASRFWKCYDALPEEVRALADKNYKLLKSDPRHPSLHFKKLAKYGLPELVFIIALSQLKLRMGFFGYGLGYILSMTNLLPDPAPNRTRHIQIPGKFRGHNT